ncbi:MAG: hypothetical protein ACE5DX_05105 [Candidatus Dojkabacteria bacterium]
MKNAKKILLVTKKSPNFDTYISLQLLAEVIKQDLGKTVEIACESGLPKAFLSQFPLPDVKKMTSLPPKSFVLEFKNQKNKVKNIQWNQSEEKLSLYLTMQGGNLNSQNLDIRVTGADHDLIVLVGVNTIAELGNLYTTSKSLFEETDIYAIGLQPQIKLPKVKVSDYQRSTTVSEQTFEYLQTNGVKVNESRASRLLAGIFSATRNFKVNVKDAKTYEVAAKLTKSGAKNETAAANALKAAGEKSAGKTGGTAKAANADGKSPSTSTPAKPTTPSAGDGALTAPQTSSQQTQRDGRAVR